MTFLATVWTAADVANALSGIMAVDVQGAADRRIAGLSAWAARAENSLSYQAHDHEQPTDGTISVPPLGSARIVTGTLIKPAHAAG